MVIISKIIPPSLRYDKLKPMPNCLLDTSVVASAPFKKGENMAGYFSYKIPERAKVPFP